MKYAEEKEGIKEKLKEFWNWLWNSDSIWSYVIFLVLVFIVIKFVFLPGLGLIFGTSLPLAIVESSSMDHRALQYCTAYDSGGQCAAESIDYEICGSKFTKSSSFNLDEYWDVCGKWYEQNTNITKSDFQAFSFKNGFRKGDIMVIFKKKTINIGDIIVFEGGSRHPIIHRAISLSPLQTKGDHNSGQLVPGNNNYGANERSIPEEKLLGTAVLKIPWLGWPKLFIVEMWNKRF